jgi:hypothetical protein
VAYACNPSYSGGSDKEDPGLKPAGANSSSSHLTSEQNCLLFWGGWGAVTCSLSSKTIKAYIWSEFASLPVSLPIKEAALASLFRLWCRGYWICFHFFNLKGNICL